MNAQEYLKAALAAAPGMSMTELLQANPALISEVKALPGGLIWQQESRDGWYYFERTHPPIGKRESVFVCEIYWQERGAALWGES